MRATSQNYGVIEANGEVIGISLGADYCAEHECGFKWKRRLGIHDVSREIYGIEARRCTELNMSTRLEKIKKMLVLCVMPQYGEKYWTVAEAVDRFSKWPMKKERDYRNPEERALSYDDLPLADVRTAWSDQGGFLIIAQTERGNQAINVVYDALIGGDLAIGYGSKSNPFSAVGLNLIAISKLPEQIKQTIADEDVGAMDLLDDIKKIGIEEKLKAAGKRWHALKGHRQEDGNIIFWLNPTEQHRNNYGWFTAEQLEQWIDGQGPIPKTES